MKLVTLIFKQETRKDNFNFFFAEVASVLFFRHVLVRIFESRKYSDEIRRN